MSEDAVKVHDAYQKPADTKASHSSQAFPKVVWVTGAPKVFDIGALYAQREADQSADDASLLEQRLDWHLQRPGDRREFVIEYGPPAALDLRNLRLVEREALPHQPCREVLLGDPRPRLVAQPMNHKAGAISSGKSLHEAPIRRVDLY